jgi:hypothetical protein
MATTKAKLAPRKAGTRRKRKSLSRPYDAKMYAGSVPAFASVVAEEMKAWRDDRYSLTFQNGNVDTEGPRPRAKPQVLSIDVVLGW